MPEDTDDSVPIADEIEDRPHISSPDCWCCPIEVEPGLWEHFLPH